MAGIARGLDGDGVEGQDGTMKELEENRAGTLRCVAADHLT
jgi:hypothetical protein